MFSSRRRHKASPSNGKDTSRTNGASPHVGGSSFRRHRQPQHLPTYHSPSASTCNNFLLGGHYYPGKDKRRIHLRKRTWWHRWFCSSPGRMLCSSVLIGYVFLWHMLVPATRILLEAGKALSGQGGEPHQVWQELKHLPSIEEEKRFIQHLQGERDEILYGVQHGMLERMKRYKVIVPDWFRIYHKKKDDVIGHDALENGLKSDSRDGAKDTKTKLSKSGSKKKLNDINKDGANDKGGELEVVEEHHDQPPNADADKVHEEIDEKQNLNDGGDGKNKPEKNDLVGKDSKADDATKGRVLRTLQNVDTLPSQSSCPDTLEPTDIKTTLVVQSSLDRAWILEETCSRWKDPIVAVVYMRGKQVSTNKTSELQAYEAKCPHLKIITHEASPNEKKWEYPVNELRNIGLDAAQTSHILVTDVDFVPSMDLHETIRDTLQELQKQDAYNAETSALVVPAFERIPPTPCDMESDCAAFLKGNSSFIPNTLDDLRSCVRKNDCSVFQQKINWEGHHSTHSESWLEGEWYEDIPSDPKDGTESSKRIKTLKCFDSLRYEPYVVLRWCPSTTTKAASTPVAPYYDERFHGYGKNKIQLIAQLRFMGYGFGILPKGFIVHNPHPESKVKATWNNMEDFDLHSDMDKLYRAFLEELYEKYRDRSAKMLASCSHKKQKGGHKNAQ